MSATAQCGRGESKETGQLLEWSEVAAALSLTKPPSQLMEVDIVGKYLSKLEQWNMFYYAYSRLIGLGVRRDKLRKDADGLEWQRIWVCSREGARRRHGNPNVSTDKRRGERAITRIGCNASLKVTLDRSSRLWVATGFRTSHNHDLATPSELQFIRCFPDVPDAFVAQAHSMRRAGIRTMNILYYMAQQFGGRQGLPFLKKDLYNKLAAERHNLDHESDSEGALGYLTALAIRDTHFFCRYNVDDEERLHNLFWADGISRNDYEVFGDVLAFDTTYRRNAYNKPLLILVGVNHHFRTTVFGVALLADETTSTFTWVLDQFKECMGGKEPIVIVTDGDLAMRAAINETFPNSTHRLCAWHLGNNAATNVPNGEFKIKFSKLLYSYYTPQEFEEHWRALITEHGLEDNGWADFLYENKRQWAETFLRGQFVGGMRTTQKCESMNSYMNQFLESKHLLRDFVSQVDQSIHNIRYTELQDDFISRHTSPPIPSDHPLKCFYEQFATAYTRSVYDVVVKQITAQNSYSVTSMDYTPKYLTFGLNKFQFGEISSVVRYSRRDNIVTCTCLLFETDGIPCRHIFTVLKHMNIVDVPRCLFKNRWRKDARVTNNDIAMQYTVSNNMFEATRVGTLAGDFNSMTFYAAKFDDTFFRAREEIQKLTEIFKKIFSNRQYIDSSTQGFNADVDASHNLVKDPVRAKTKGRERTSNIHSKLPTSEKRRKRCRNCNELGHNRTPCKSKQMSQSLRATNSSATTKENDDDETNLGREDSLCNPTSSTSFPQRSCPQNLRTSTNPWWKKYPTLAKNHRGHAMLPIHK